jgi:signal transduction histidine kinase
VLPPSPSPQREADAFLEFQSIVASLDLGLWRYDVESQSLDWDTSVYRRYGVSREQFPTAQQFWLECLTEDSMTRARQEMELALGGEKDYHAVYELTLPHGETRHVLARAKVIRDGLGRPTHLYGINMDVTQQTNVELENQRLLARLREAQAIAQTGSWTFDIAAQTLTWSSELYRIYEIPEPQPAEELYALYRSKIHPDDKKTLDQLIERAVRNGEGFVFDYRLVLGEGRIKHVQGIGQVSKDQNGRPFRLGGTCRDQTKEIELQRTLENERAKSSRNARLASLGELSAGVAHEINNPLAIIDGNARMLADCMDDPAVFSSKIQSILNACNRISRIIGGLKQFAGKSETTSFRKHPLRDIIGETLELVEAKARTSRAEITVTLHTDARILCDKLRIEQVLINLIDNAIDAVQAGQERWIEVTAADEGTEAVIRVSNSGPRIPAEVHEKLFTPFFTTKGIGQGTGLGLSISKGIVEDHNGSIALVERARNTCFEVRLPK